MQRRDRVGAVARLEREHRHAELFVAVDGIDAAERHEALAVDAERFAQRTEVLFDERRREAIVAGRDRRVRREDDLRCDAPQRLPRRRCLRSTMR